MSIELPAAIAAFIDATNRGDSDAFVAAFTPDAHLDDWGRGFDGHAGILAWDRSDNIGKRSHFELVDAVSGDSPDSYLVTLTVSGDGYNGTGPMRFELRDGLIAALLIS
ncbi:nuclear transport factor 2 family protein [Gryllotalpicola protaetiae]|uniref:Nuclear transport factor 2 family protein n=1 Tax=Gryllotalpicola protaetiae TaxID=2419771 RepID=A0A387C396_9MICO|nr:nuclear transport factor 2 family protein [Gryllotalpicola protaetiae]AYG05031.1 nuclear transport factor 2 family protein [Gryllotalpicola protaetiae]